MSYQEFYWPIPATAQVTGHTTAWWQSRIGPTSSYFWLSGDLLTTLHSKLPEAIS